MTAKKKPHRYKLKDIKLYYSLDKLFKSRKYRSVFSEGEVDYLRAELNLYNILFDEEDWEGTVKYKCYEKGETKELFEIEEAIKVPKSMNVFQLRKGWGNEKKTFWNKGDYTWKVYVDDEFVGSKDFYIEKGGIVSSNENPYFDIQSVKLFECGDKTPAKPDRTYLTTFNTKETAYFNVELNLLNKLDYGWQCELEFNIYDVNNMLVANMTEMKTFTGNSLSMVTGWGNAAKSGWSDGTYTCEIIFMSHLIAVVPFTMASEAIEGTPPVLDNELKELDLGAQAEMQEKDLDELLLDLDQLIGLTAIKKEVREYVDYLKFEEIRKEKGLKSSNKINLHTVFTGNPGTGKTTVAKKLGKIYKAMGLLSSGHVHEVDRSDLVGEYIGQTAPKVVEAINKARGGVLFIDEAYALAREGESKKDYGKEVIEILLKEMSDGEGNLAVFVAGYPKEMNIFVNSNPGLKSRFNNFYHFPDYLPEELSKIAKLNLDEKGLIIGDEAMAFLNEKILRAYRDRDESFGNARFVISLVNGAKMNMALRLVKEENPEELTKDQLSTITQEDIQQMFVETARKKLDLVIDEPRLKDALNELESLIGMNNIKQEIRDMVKLVRYYNEIGRDVLHKFALHTVFKGNPGTGKTTVARIFAKIFNALGIIEQGHLVECDRSALVGEYSGQTAPKTLAKVEDAIGGVLFVDEAYALVDGPHDSLGKESISTLLKQMEDRKSEFIMIAAGYPNNMDRFLESNPGLKSRFDQTLVFEDYNEEELFKIAEFMFYNEELAMDEESGEILKSRLRLMYNARDEHFGNAREVRKLVQEVTQIHHLRMADLDKTERTVKMITTITKEDLQRIKPYAGAARKAIGFQPKTDI